MQPKKKIQYWELRDTKTYEEYFCIQGIYSLVEEKRKMQCHMSISKVMGAQGTERWER